MAVVSHQRGHDTCKSGWLEERDLKKAEVIAQYPLATIDTVMEDARDDTRLIIRFNTVQTPDLDLRFNSLFDRASFMRLVKNTDASIQIANDCEELDPLNQRFTYAVQFLNSTKRKLDRSLVVDELNCRVERSKIMYPIDI